MHLDSQSVINYVVNSAIAIFFYWFQVSFYIQKLQNGKNIKGLSNYFLLVIIKENKDIGYNYLWLGLIT